MKQTTHFHSILSLTCSHYLMSLPHTLAYVSLLNYIYPYSHNSDGSLSFHTSHLYLNPFFDLKSPLIFVEKFFIFVLLKENLLITLNFRKCKVFQSLLYQWVRNVWSFILISLCDLMA
jgi:hypothetical protein